VKRNRKGEETKYYVHWISNGSSNLGIDYRRDKAIGPIISKRAADATALHVALVTFSLYRGEVKTKLKAGYKAISLGDYLKQSRLDLYEDVYSLRDMLSRAIRDEKLGATLCKKIIKSENAAKKKVRNGRRRKRRV